MASTVGAPSQHKQPSRKTKRAWRKNVDISEVQQGLETLRDEVIQGGPIAEKSLDELFVLDTKGSDDLVKKHKLRKPLKVDEILAKTSAVPAVDGRKRAASRTTDGVLEPASKKQKKDWVSKKEVQRMKNDINVQSQLTSQRLEEDGGTEFDLWAVQEQTTSEPVETTEYIPKRREKVMPGTIRRAPIALTASGKPIRAVKNPDAGTSYNPTFEDWDSLLDREGAREVEAEQKRLQLEAEKAEKEARIAALAATVDEAGAKTDDESAWEGFETENEDPEGLKRKRPQRMTPAQRNKAKRKKRAEQLANHEKAVVRKQQMAERGLTTVSDEKDLVSAAEAIQALDSSADEDDRRLRRRKMGPAVVPEKALEVVLPDELQESLRRLRPEGNLMTDRFRNLLVNGKIESRKPIVQPRKRKVKVTEKWAYKDFSIAA